MEVTKVIKVNEIKKGDIFLKNNKEYKITAISNCLTKHKKLNLTAVNAELNEKIEDIFPANYELKMVNNYILLDEISNNTTNVTNQTINVTDNSTNCMEVTKVIKVNDIKKGDIFLKNNKKYKITHVHNCLERFNGFGFEAIGMDSNQKLEDIYHANYEFKVVNNYILLDDITNNTTNNSAYYTNNCSLS